MPEFSQRSLISEFAAEFKVTNNTMLYRASACGTKKVALRSDAVTKAGSDDESDSIKIAAESAVEVCR